MRIEGSPAFGRMEFAPEVGPVYCIERSVFPRVEGALQTGIADEYEYWMIGTKGGSDH